METAALQVVLELDGWQALAVIGKALTYGSSFAAAGGVIFLGLFSHVLSPREVQAQRRFVVRMAWLAMVLSVLRIAVINGLLSGELAGMVDGAMTRVVLASAEGPATGLRLLGLLVIALFCRPGLHQRWIYWLWAALPGVIVVATSFALVGHAGEASTHPALRYLPQTLLCLHLLAVSFWLGALWPLYRLTDGDDVTHIAHIMHRFGQLALGVVALLLLAGLALLWLLLGNLAALWTSAYGQLFLLKLAAVAALLALAASNKLFLTPRLLRGDPSALLTLRRSIRLEIVVASVILLLTASLTTLVGPA